MKEQGSPKAALLEADAAFKRLRELLAAQRDKLGLCVKALAKQKEKIAQGRGEDALFHAELLEQWMADISAIQRVIDPLLARFPCQKEPEIQAAAKNILAMQREAQKQARENTDLLRARKEFLAAEIQKIRTNPLRKR
ncbi:MAG: hypothetical protein LBD13_01505, partial [Spirochaetaceae bacterium]|nr:hypothetical protein [Spirochaetaceae bacterium]